MSDDDSERISIREELKSLSFEELLKLKEELGSKLYNKSVFENAPEKIGSHSNKFRKFTRENKNRPREESSKVRVKSRNLLPSASEKPTIRRDPRFEPLCGEFKEEKFKKNYGFIDEIKKREFQQLKKLLKKESDEEERKRIKVLLQRMSNQLRSDAEKMKKSEDIKTEKAKNLELIKSGMKPQFKTRGEKKAISLIDKYERLKKDGKLDKYVEKKSKKKSKKDKLKSGAT